MTTKLSDMRGKRVRILNEAHGPITLTQVETDYIIAVAKRESHGAQTSTPCNLVIKIRKATGWEMRPTQMFCRFAYKHGLVEL